MFDTSSSTKEFSKQLNKVYGWYIGGFAIFLVVLGALQFTRLAICVICYLINQDLVYNVVWQSLPVSQSGM